MPATLDGQLVVAISSRACSTSKKRTAVRSRATTAPTCSLQLDRLDEPAKPGVAFSLVNKLLAFNTPSSAAGGGGDPVAQRPGLGHARVPLGQHYGLPIQRGVFTRGESPWRYLQPLNANLFLSTNEADVRSALDAGVPAARVYPHSARASSAHPHEVRIAFDGDAVLFSDEAERVFQRAGLDAFQAHERERAAKPLAAGPFKPLLQALQRLQHEPSPHMRIRTALVTARSAPAHERAIRTLMDWNIEVDEAMFLGGLAKGEFLREFEPDFFFDDQTGHIENAAAHVPSGHVASGISNP